MKHPRWLQYVVAFFGPAFGSLAGGLAMVMATAEASRGWAFGIALVTAGSAGFGGLVGLGFNDWRKFATSGATTEADE